MSVRATLWISSVLLLVAVAFGRDQGQDLKELAASQGRELLKGLSGVFVLVEHIPEVLEKLGLTADQVSTDVELTLRRNGVTVLTEEEMFAAPGTPYLYVRIDGRAIEGKDVACVAHTIELKEKVALVRQPSQRVMATTWSTRNCGYVGFSRIPDLRDFIKDDVDRFCNSYLAANPPQPPAP